MIFRPGAAAGGKWHPIVMWPVFKAVLPAALIVAAGSTAGAATGHASPRIEFNRDIRPIITENCYACHGPDKNQRKAKLRLDQREVALARGAIVPGKPDESKLIEHVFSTDPDEVMPPPKTRKVLSAEQKELLRQWIADGAEYEPHWAYIPLRRPVVPQPKNGQWLRTPIDAFILSVLDEKGIRPSAEAPKAELLRRLSLDLIGLPPTPDELQDFLEDTSAGAYEKQVDRLLGSPHFGERMAVPWLDVVRYADTVGYHGDQNQNIFPYRDYVINAFNRNKPFDQFTIEQIAGDLLPAPTVEQQIASGFNRLNMVTREGGAQPKEYLAKYAADRARTISMAWLGSTMGCAECHDHKYDPFTSKDFYQMEAFFADIKQWGVYADYDYTPNADLKGVGNDHPFPPEIEVNSPYLRQRIARLQAEQDRVFESAAVKLKSDAGQRRLFAAWRKASLGFLENNPSGWITPVPQVDLRMHDTNALATTNFQVNGDATVRLTAQARDNTRLLLPVANQWLSAIRLEVVPQVETKDPTGGATRFEPASLSLKASLRLNGKEESKLKFCRAEADHETRRYSNGHPVLGVRERWELSPYHGHQTAVWLLDKPVQVQANGVLAIELGGAQLASVRVSLSPFASTQPLQAELGAPLHKALGKVLGTTRADRDLIERTFLLSTVCDSQAADQIDKLQEGIRECRQGRAFTMVTVAREPRLTRVLRRGNWQDEGGDVVEPLAPHFLPQIPNPEHRRLNRLDLARWLVSEQNPLTSRALMNRMWKEFFGTGLSAVVDDLGAQGEWPIHPNLINWLACEFMRPADTQVTDPGGRSPFAWDIKHMVKLMVMSATYRQDSNQRPELKEIDPNNRLLACQSPRRLEAEFVRDNALAIAGLLNGDVGGPSVFPYQPAGYYAYLQWPDREYYPDTDDRQYRRGLYTHWQRAFLHPMLANFDAPSREECTANRVVSDTPQQALTLLNDPTFVEAARVFAAHVLTSGRPSDAQKLDAAFERALARPPRPAERASLLEFLDTQRRQYHQAPEAAAAFIRVGNRPVSRNDAPAELAAWTQVCRVILNLHETITRY